MTLTQIWGALLIFTVCPLVGGLPLIAWITYSLTGQQLGQVGTGNVSVSAAFYHGGRVAGILAVLSEALKGIGAVLLGRYLFPTDPAWELISLLALVLGRYWIGRGAGTTNVVWGVLVHDWVAAGLVFLVGSISFSVLREKQWGKVGVLIFFPSILVLLHRDGKVVGSAIALSSLLYWIYHQIPDDLDLPQNKAQGESRKMFRFLQGNKVISLDAKLNPQQVGQKAATLSQLRGNGYPVPEGWVLRSPDDISLMFLQPSIDEPLIVRSSAVGEDSPQASAAGQYESILNVTTQEELKSAIAQVFASYHTAAAVSYRKNRSLPDAEIAVLIQKQIPGIFSGVAFSRDPIARQGDTVAIEALPGDATRVVSGQVTPEQYRVAMRDGEVEESGDIPTLIQQVASLARQLEAFYHGIPQDIEWTYDGQKLWLLQARPITTLQPIWTRKIAAEVIPGLIRPLTWSINRPLTCGVWGDIFTVVLGTRAQGLDFEETATLHYSRAYFNATLLGEIFLRMGLPAQSLEFLTRGAKFSKPPLISTLKNVPGLLRLLARELRLEQDFGQFEKRRIADGKDSLQRIDEILELLKEATYFSILAPLSFSLRQGIFGVKDEELDNSQLPEVAALRSLAQLANRVHPGESINDNLGAEIIAQFNSWLAQYGYLSEAATDIAVPRWRENPQSLQDLFRQYLLSPQPVTTFSLSQSWKAKQVQKRLNLKGQVTEAYSQLLAELRYSFVALEQDWLQSGLITEVGDIFFFEFDEIRGLISGNGELREKVPMLVKQRRSLLEQDRQLTPSPLVYGNVPPQPIQEAIASQKILRGIAASPGQVEGQVKVMVSLTAVADIDSHTILVVPYTDSGWSPLLARVGGLIAEVGGRLSHGAIVAREYRIPAVMDIHNATQLLQDGQRVRIDGLLGVVEVLED